MNTKLLLGLVAFAIIEAKVRHHIKKEVLTQAGTNWYNVGNCTQYNLTQVAKRFKPNDTFSCSEG
jgi:hypothetical protein